MLLADKIAKKTIIDESKDCGGEDLSVRLIEGTKECETGKYGVFAKGQTLEWNNLGTCNSNRKFDLHEDRLQFKLKTTSTNKFCACQLKVTFEHGIVYRSICTKDFENSLNG